MAYSNVVEHAQAVQTQIAALNLAVRKALPTLTLLDARKLDKIVRESEDWLLGIRKSLLWPQPATEPPGDETPEGSQPSAPLP